MKKTGNQFYIDRVGKGDYPEASIVPTDDTFDDERGTICNLLLSPIMSVARITSKRGSVRANHYHLTDWHYTLVESGEIYYFKRQIGSTVIQDPERMPPGTMFFTPPNVEHAMLFTEDTVFFTFAKNIRSHNSHESDLVRVTFITDEIAGRYL